MSSHVVVMDSSLRRAQIKVNPGTFMTEVVEEACKKLKLMSSNYGLKHKEKAVDLTRTFRLTGLTSGAKLELVQSSKTPSAVTVALQLPADVATGASGSRLTDKVASDTTLWKILRHFETKGGANHNFTARGITQVENGASGAGRIFYEMPSINIINRELSTFGDLQKTLAQLGINSGTAMMRLSFKKTDQPLEEAMREIETYFKEEEAPVQATPPQEVESITKAIEQLPNAGGEPQDANIISGNSEATSSADPTPYLSSTPDLPTAITPSKRPATESTPPPEPTLGPGQRPISIYRPPSNDVPIASTTPYNDDDFEPTIAHAKLHQTRLLAKTQNQRLPSDAEIERLEQERKAKMASATNVAIKVRFPDQSSIVSSFSATDTGATLYTFVRGIIAAEKDPFKLIWIEKGVQTVPDGGKLLIKDLGFERSVLVNFHWEDDARESIRKQTILKPEYVKKAQEFAVPTVPVVDAGEEDRSPAVKEKPKDGAGGAKKGKGLSSILKGFSKK